MKSMLTAIEMSRQQGRSTFAYLTAAMEFHLAKKPAPSLLPVA
jgi:hypothetical protein